MQNQTAQAIEEALRSTKRLVVTFQRNAIPNLIYLWRMVIGGQIQLSREDQENLESIRKTRSWFDDESRTMTLCLTERFEWQTFVDQLGRDGVLQQIAVAK